MDPGTFQRAVENLRRSRTRPDRRVDSSELFTAVGAEAGRTARRLGDTGGAWGELCPEAWRDRTSVEGVSRGVLTVRVTDSAARFELDRWLRAGGEDALIRACRTGIRKVKLVAGAASAP